MKMDSPYFFYNREHIEDSQPENEMSLLGKKGTMVIIDECSIGVEAALAACLGTVVLTQDRLDAIMADAEAASKLETMKEEGLEVIVMDSLTALEDQLAFFGHADQQAPLRVMVAGAGYIGSRGEMRNLGKSIMRAAIVRHSLSLAYMEPADGGYDDDKYNNWKDFIQNPARPGRQIKKQKPPKQSFKAQMRSVNRNR